MNKIKKGSVVIKKTDNNKIIFTVEKIKLEKKKKMAILKGVYVRIIEKLPVEELVNTYRGSGHFKKGKN